MNMKPIECLTAADVSASAIWEYVDEEEYGEADVMVRAVAERPIVTLVNRLAATQLKLADGSERWGLLGNVDTRSAERTRQFLMVSVLCGDYWFCLARYFDIAYDGYGPHALAEYLGRPVSDVFPIRYDISSVVHASLDITVGLIHSEPQNRLSQEEVLRLSKEFGF